MHDSEISEETERLGELLLNVTDEILKRLFKDGADAIYHYLESSSHFRREEIAEKPDRLFPHL